MSINSVLAFITRCSQICAADKAKHYTPHLAQEIADAANGEIGEKKILIFSWFLGPAWNIAQRLGPEAVCTVTNNGETFNSMSAGERDALFERVRHDPKIKYVVTTAAAREGHNLEFCWWTIFNDPWWSPLSHYQGESRCIRLTNPHPIDSFYVRSEVDTEEVRFGVLAEKLKIAEQVTDGVEAARELTISTAAEVVKRLKEKMWKKD